jgi:putative thioredoxin
MGVQSIPAVFAFKDGKPVDGFQGAIAESQIKSFISRLLGPDAKLDDSAELEAANQALEAGDVNGAAQVFAAILAKDNENADAIGGLAKCYLQTGDLARAEETLALAPSDKASAAAIASAKAMLELARKSGDGGDTGALRAAVEQNPDDHQARFDLALALAGAGEREAAAEELLTIMRADRAWQDDGARKQLLQFFDAWGPKDPATLAGRQALSLLLFS